MLSFSFAKDLYCWFYLYLSDKVRVYTIINDSFFPEMFWESLNSMLSSGTYPVFWSSLLVSLPLEPLTETTFTSDQNGVGRGDSVKTLHTVMTEEFLLDTMWIKMDVFDNWMALPQFWPHELHALCWTRLAELVILPFLRLRVCITFVGCLLCF